MAHNGTIDRAGGALGSHAANLWTPNPGYRRGTVRPIPPSELARITGDRDAAGFDELTPGQKARAWAVLTVAAWAILGGFAAVVVAVLS